MDKRSESSKAGGHYTGTGDKSDLSNHSNQCNPNNQEYKGYTSNYQGSQEKPNMDNRSNQMNPNNPAYQGKT